MKKVRMSLLNCGLHDRIGYSPAVYSKCILFVPMIRSIVHRLLAGVREANY